MCNELRIPFLLVCSLALVGCGDESSSPDPVDFAELCPESARGTFVDARDSNEYAYTTIGDQKWMAENLKYNLKYSICHDSIAENCDKYGRLYVFQHMTYNLLGRVSEFDFIWDSVYTLCPKGWRVPKLRDFEHLREQVQADGNSLIAKEDGGSDMCGFNLKLAGEYSYRGVYEAGGYFYGKGEMTSLWSQTRRDVGMANVQDFYKEREIPDIYWESILDGSIEGKINYMGYVRCIKE